MQQKTTYAALALGSLMLVPVAQAEPLSLSPAEMDSVTAGQTVNLSLGLIEGGTGGTGTASSSAFSDFEAHCRDNCTVSATTFAQAEATGTGGTGGSVADVTLDIDLDPIDVLVE